MNPYDSGGEKGQQVRAMFDSVAHRYDRLNHILSLGVDRLWRRRVARMVARAVERAGCGERASRRAAQALAVSFSASANAGAAILDVATGTGDMAIALARHCPTARIIGVDVSPKMLAIGREKVARAGLSGRITLLDGSAEALPLPDGGSPAGGGRGERASRPGLRPVRSWPAAFLLRASAIRASSMTLGLVSVRKRSPSRSPCPPLPSGGFAAATVAFGVRNFSDIAAGLREIHRVLREGGGVYILEFSTPRVKIFGYLYRWYFHRVVPRVGGWISGDRCAYAYLPASVDEFPAPERFLEMMRGAGFDECAAKRVFFGIVMIYNGTKI